MTLDDRLAAVGGRIAERLAAVMAGLPPGPVTEAMAYATEGGKRLRGFLVVESARLHDADPQGALQAAVAIEAVHAYSLVHDDLPCMDDDDTRRGRPTVHRRWDEAVAVLAGDALQSLAFDLLARPATSTDPAVRLALVASLARAAGIEGMVQGQARDMAAERAGAPLGIAEVMALQAEKTGALIVWSAEAGAILAGAETAPMRRYAACLGAAFQIADDLLDVTGDAGRAGKALRKDERAGKATFVSILGVDGARARAAALVEDACDALRPWGAGAETLRQVARFTISRDH